MTNDNINRIPDHIIPNSTITVYFSQLWREIDQQIYKQIGNKVKYSVEDNISDKINRIIYPPVRNMIFEKVEMCLK